MSQIATKGLPRVALFVTCLVDLYRPSVGFAAIKLLEAAGCQVEVPEAQTCCGQPAYNSGDRATAKDLARNVIDTFLPYVERELRAGRRLCQISRHVLGLFQGCPGGRQFRRHIAEHGNAPDAGISVLRDAAARVPGSPRISLSA
jgi:L-lactate dehydrogenase complex protein LldE